MRAFRARLAFVGLVATTAATPGCAGPADTAPPAANPSPALPPPPGPDPFAALMASEPAAIEQVRALLLALPCPLPGLPPEIARLVDCSLLRIPLTVPWVPQPPVNPLGLGSYVDHRQMGLIGLVRDQGQVGSCQSQAAAAILDTAARRAGRPQLFGSAMHLYVNYQDQTFATYNQKLERNVTADAVWPYVGPKACAFEDDPDRPYCAAYYHTDGRSGFSIPAALSERAVAEQEPAFQITQIELIDVARDLNAIASIVASGEPLLVGVHMAQNWTDSSFQGSVLPPPVGVGGPHSLVFRGYRYGPYGREWLLQNSWGTSWGDGGFVWMQEQMLLATQLFAMRLHVRVVG